MKNLLILLISLSCSVCSFANSTQTPSTMVVSLSLQASTASNLQLLNQATRFALKQNVKAMALDFSEPYALVRVQNRGDFYYFIGDLTRAWGKSDYSRFYTAARILGEKGFRTIVNVEASISDVRAAVQNPETAGIIWNSHGSEDGAVYDIKNHPLPKNIFADRSEKLRFVLFANCYGYTSIDYYNIGGQTLGVGWKEENNSSNLFSYLRSEDFEHHLEQAFGH